MEEKQELISSQATKFSLEAE
jgi:hypothetical protein